MKPVVFSSILSKFKSSTLWGWHFLVPDDIASGFILGTDRRVVCTINDQLTLHCALMPNKNTWFILLNQSVQKKLKSPENSEIKISLIKDTSEYGMPMPEELREVLNQDIDADTFFHALTPGKQRSLIYIVGKVKNTESKIRKSLAIADHLTSNKGKIDGKLLYEALKEYNKI